MMKPFLLCGITVLVVIGFASAHVSGALVDASTSYSSATLWEGFGEDFLPEWEGETTVVDTWVEPVGSGSGWTSSGTTCGQYGLGIFATGYSFGSSGHWEECGGHWETHPTVSLTSSHSSNSVLNSTVLRSDGHDYTAKENDYNKSELARYATLAAPNGKLLANASTISYQNTDIGEDEFSAEGRVSAVAILANAALDALADATGSFNLDASYRLDQETAFSLELDIARFGEVDFCFKATDKATGEVAFSFSDTETGTQQQISMNGILDAGEYKFSLDCVTDASVDSDGLLNVGGQALFDVSLDLEEEYVQVWVPDYVWVSGGSGSYWSQKDFVGDLGMRTSIPEPGMLCLICIGLSTCLAVRVRVTK